VKEIEELVLRYLQREPVSKLLERENVVVEKVYVSSEELGSIRVKVRERRERRLRSTGTEGEARFDQGEIEVSEEVLLRQAREKESQIRGLLVPKVEKQVEAAMRLFG
jgi:hypothetical protein